MTTTDLIKLLKDFELRADGKPREICVWRKDKKIIEEKESFILDGHGFFEGELRFFIS